MSLQSSFIQFFICKHHKFCVKKGFQINIWCCRGLGGNLFVSNAFEIFVKGPMWGAFNWFSHKFIYVKFSLKTFRILFFNTFLKFEKKSGLLVFCPSIPPSVWIRVYVVCTTLTNICQSTEIHSAKFSHNNADQNNSLNINIKANKNAKLSISARI